MAQQFAFLRAINTGGRRLTNDQLLAPFRDLGLEDVAAYQAAGNVAFRSARPAVDLEGELELVLAAAYGFEVPVFVRTSAELQAVVADLPFSSSDLDASQGKAQITFLRSTPTADVVAEAMALVPAEDRVAFVGREWFWLPRTGVSDSLLPVTRIERIVGPMTMRTVGTVERMLARFPA